MIYMIIYITYYDIRQIGNMFICSQLIFFFCLFNFPNQRNSLDGVEGRDLNHMDLILVF